MCEIDGCQSFPDVMKIPEPVGIFAHWTDVRSKRDKERFKVSFLQVNTFTCFRLI